MAETAENHAEITASEVTHPEETPQTDNVCKEDSNADVSMEAMDVESSSDTCNNKSNSADKKEYSEEEKLKRKEYFKGLNKTRKLARDKYRQNFAKQLATNPMSLSSFVRPSNNLSAKSILSRKMTEEDKKMLEFYKVRLSTLRSENELLHKRLVYLVNENMRFLQMGPRKTSS